MGASGAASPLHKPEFGLVRQLEGNCGMPHAIRLTNPRKHKRVLGPLQDIRAIAKHPSPVGYRCDRFRLMFEAGAIDQTNRIMGAN
jgi:hypothetical protein